MNTRDLPHREEPFPSLTADRTEKVFFKYEGRGQRIVLGSPFAWVLIALVDMFCGGGGIAPAIKSLTAEIKTVAGFITHLRL